MIKNPSVLHCRIYSERATLKKKFENSIHADYAIV